MAELNWPQQMAAVDRELDADLRSDVLFNMDQNTRCLTQVVRLLRMVTQTKPTE